MVGFPQRFQSLPRECSIWSSCGIAQAARYNFHQYCKPPPIGPLQHPSCRKPIKQPIRRVNRSPSNRVPVMSALFTTRPLMDPDAAILTVGHAFNFGNNLGVAVFAFLKATAPPMSNSPRLCSLKCSRASSFSMFCPPLSDRIFAAKTHPFFSYLGKPVVPTA